MGEKTFRDVNFGQITQGSVSVISIYGDLALDGQAAAHDAQIVGLYVINNADVDVDERAMGATIPANQPRRLTPETRKVQAEIASPNGLVNDGDVTSDIKVAWGDDLEEVRNEE